jgi:hypothetical protein
MMEEKTGDNFTINTVTSEISIMAYSAAHFKHQGATLHRRHLPVCKIINKKFGEDLITYFPSLAIN